jgi:mono/diheme cytochrome c family protein
MAPIPENGAPIYAEKCAPCHGEAGLGDGPQAAQLPNPVSPLGDPEFARQSTPARWYTQVTQGNLERFMPPFNSLSDRERWDVVAYAYSLSAPQEIVSQGDSLYQENCAGCHGETGQGDGSEAAGLSTPPTDFTDQAWMAQQTSAGFYQAITDGVAPGMPAFGDRLSEGERWLLADYLRWLSFAEPETPVEEAALAQGTTPEPQTGATGLPATELPATSEASTGQPGEAGGSETKTGPTEVASAEVVLGNVTGQVTNASGGEVPEGLVVTLHGFDEMQSVLTDTTTLGPDGAYIFEGVEMRPGRAFLVAVEFGEATYGSDIGVVEPEKTSVDLPVTVYETTTDASILSGDRLHLFFEFTDEKTIRVIELFILSNPTNQTLVAAEEGQPTITFKLPEGAANLEFQDGVLGERFVQTADGFGDTAAVRPGSGSYQVLFAFDLPYDRKLDLVQPISVPVNSVVILIPEGSVKIKSDMLQDGGVRDVEGVKYHTYSVGSLSAGQELRLSLTGRPGSASPTLSAGSSSGLAIGLAVFGLALILAGVWFYRRTRSGRVGEEEHALAGAAEAASYEDADTVMDAILALDDLYQAGEIPEGAYRQRRSELKARLRELME